jgi:hypothetical protein
MTAPFVLDFQRAGQAAARAGEAKTTVRLLKELEQSSPDEIRRRLDARRA